MKRIALVARILSTEYKPSITDQQIFKDYCLIPILLGKYYGYEVSIITHSINREFLHQYFPNVDVPDINVSGDYLNDFNNYMKYHAQDIDIVFAMGAYNTYGNIIQNYKSLNPQGKVYLKMDMNRIWLSRCLHDWEFKRTLELCDLVSVEDTRIQDIINTHYKVDTVYIPNGYYEFLPDKKIAFDEKENIILSVGRLGIREKNTKLLIDAFLRANLKEWKLRLVGSIADEFQDTLNEYKRRKEFNDRVELVGVISDKEEIYKEYERAKIFIMTSRKEACAHVYSEALRSGCFVISTDVDGVENLICHGQYGHIVEREEEQVMEQKIAEAIKQTAVNDFLRNKCNEVQEYAQNELSWKTIIGKIQLLFISRGILE